MGPFWIGGLDKEEEEAGRVGGIVRALGRVSGAERSSARDGGGGVVAMHIGSACGVGDWERGTERVKIDPRGYAKVVSPKRSCF